GWQLVDEAERLPAERGDLARLELLWQRIWSQRPEVPLGEWAIDLSRH
ncbi:MAG: metal-dependent hydrolase, partial [Stutzerimonas sp.]